MNALVKIVHGFEGRMNTALGYPLKTGNQPSSRDTETEGVKAWEILLAYGLASLIMAPLLWALYRSYFQMQSGFFHPFVEVSLCGLLCGWLYFPWQCAFVALFPKRFGRAAIVAGIVWFALALGLIYRFDKSIPNPEALSAMMIKFLDLRVADVNQVTYLNAGSFLLMFGGVFAPLLSYTAGLPTLLLVVVLIEVVYRATLWLKDSAPDFAPEAAGTMALSERGVTNEVRTSQRRERRWKDASERFVTRFLQHFAPLDGLFPDAGLRQRIYDVFMPQLEIGGDYKALCKAFRTVFHPDKAAAKKAFTPVELTLIFQHFQQHFEEERTAKMR